MLIYNNKWLKMFLLVPVGSCCFDDLAAAGAEHLTSFEDRMEKYGEMILSASRLASFNRFQREKGSVLLPPTAAAIIMIYQNVQVKNDSPRLRQSDR